MTADAIESFARPEEAVGYAQQKLGYDLRYSVADSIMYWPDYERALIEDFPQLADRLHLLGESHLSHPDTVAAYRGRPMSSVHFLEVYEFLATYGRLGELERILDIGGGYGALARLWLMNCPRLKRYYLVDLPETLFFAEVYLRGNFPGLDVSYVREGTTLEEIERSDAHIVMCPAQLAPALRGFRADLALNCCSMQEMPESAVIYWCEWIEASQAAYYYSLNYFLQPDWQVKGGSANWLCPRLGPDWDCLVTRFDPPLLHELTMRHYREVLYRRVPSHIRSREHQAFLAEQIVATHSAPSFTPRGQVVAELFEAVRLANSLPAIMRLVDIFTRLYDYRPKELVYLCELGLRSAEASAEQRERLTTVLEELRMTAKEEHGEVIPTTPLF
jgi:putative sugar O-methyltransferase